MSEPWPPLGSIVTFDVSAESLALGLPRQEQDKKLRRFAGEVVGNQPMRPFGIGKIPTRAITVRGKTGRSVTIDGAGTDLKSWPSWTEADAACKEFNK